MKIEAGHWIVTARAHLLHLLGCTLFTNKSVTHVHVAFLDALRDLTQSGGYAWGTTALCWIYEHFSSVGSDVPAEDYDERRPCACRWTSGKALPVSTYRRRLDRLTPDVSILPHPVVSSLSVEESDDRWMQFGEHIAPVGQLCAVSGHCSPDYMDWFYMISHPFMSLTQLGDPPRVPSVQQYEEFVEANVY
ncbi:hypothetical protein GmHk_18G052320 [Glycine max]|nr:hypothetical protein GmHk_18G052320 [Glycine max]